MAGRSPAGKCPDGTVVPMGPMCNGPDGTVVPMGVPMWVVPMGVLPMGERPVR